MGQYHELYNIDRKEYVHAHRIGNGLKLLEQVSGKGSTADVLFLLVANSNGRGGGDAGKHPLIGSWAGDRIVVQGDYAEPADKGYISEDERGTYADISAAVKEMLAAAY